MKEHVSGQRSGVMLLCLCVTACGAVPENGSAEARRSSVLVSSPAANVGPACREEIPSVGERAVGLPNELRAVESQLASSAVELTVARFGSERDPLSRASIPVEVAWSMRATTPCVESLVAGFAALQVSLQSFLFDDPVAARVYLAFRCDQFGEGCMVRVAGPAAVPASQEFSERVSHRVRDESGSAILELTVVTEWTYAGDDGPVVESYQLSLPDSQ